MTIRARIIALCSFALLAPLAASAAEIVILVNQGAAPGVRELAAGFERASGHTVTVLQPEDEEMRRRLDDGSADLVTGNPPGIAEFVADGLVVADSVTPFVMAGLGVSVQAGAPKPDISTVEAYVAALRAAETIGYSFGCSGTNVAAGIEQLGLSEELAGKTTRTTDGPVTAYLARGAIELGIQQTNIMVGVEGTDYVGPVPGALNMACQSDVALSAASRQPEAARAMIEYMISEEAGPLLRRTHVEPIHP
jgi:molybdate transport system substrate-binding protein